MSKFPSGKGDGPKTLEALQHHTQQSDAGKFDDTIYKRTFMQNEWFLNEWFKNQASTHAVERDDSHSWKSLCSPLTAAQLKDNGRCDSIAAAKIARDSKTRHQSTALRQKQRESTPITPTNYAPNSFMQVQAGNKTTNFVGKEIVAAEAAAAERIQNEQLQKAHKGYEEAFQRNLQEIDREPCCTCDPCFKCSWYPGLDELHTLGTVMKGWQNQIEE